jgi:NADPH2:quinone reductase
MPQAIVLRTYGGPETLRSEPVEVGVPGPDEIRLRQTAIGVNYHDVYVRTGLYQTLPLPGIPGIEAVGVVEETGPEVKDIAPGDRIGYVTNIYGAYASDRLLPASLAIPIPDSIDDNLAATILLKGMTANMLVRQVHSIAPGMTVLVHAAAGGVGRLVSQWATALGASVIGTVGDERKRQIALAAGCVEAILYREVDFVPEVRRITGGRGVDVAFDGVGGETFYGSLDALATFGHLVNFGQSAGPVAPLHMPQLAAKSASVSRPIIFHAIADTVRRDRMAEELFAAFADGTLSAEPGQPFPLDAAGDAHALLESRTATSPLILVTGDHHA